MNYESSPMRSLLTYITLVICIVLIHSTSVAESPAKAIKEGNALYQEEKYDEAAQKYREAEEISPDSDIANFNLGAALFKNEKFQESVDAFTRSLDTENMELEADAAYNIANAKHKLGKGMVESDMNGAADLYRESLDYYKRAIELNENNMDAKHNHELTDRDLKILLKKIEEQPKQQQGEEGDKKQDGDEEKQEDQQSQSEPREDEEEKEQQQSEQKNQNEQEDQEKQKAGESQEEQADNEKDGEGKSPSPAEKDPGKMSPEEARMLLDAYAEDEAMDNLQKRKTYNTGVLKDW